MTRKKDAPGEAIVALVRLDTSPEKWALPACRRAFVDSRATVHMV